MSLSNFILLTSKSDSLHEPLGDIILIDCNHKKMIKIMYEILCENDLALNIIEFADELAESTIAKMKNYQSMSVKYESFEIISKFLILFKELLLVSVLKLHNLKITNICSHSVIIHLKSKISFMESSINNYIESLENITEEHLITFKNILKMLSTLKNDELKIK